MKHIIFLLPLLLISPLSQAEDERHQDLGKSALVNVDTSANTVTVRVQKNSPAVLTPELKQQQLSKEQQKRLLTASSLKAALEYKDRLCSGWDVNQFTKQPGFIKSETGKMQLDETKCMNEKVTIEANQSSNVQYKCATNWSVDCKFSYERSIPESLLKKMDPELHLYPRKNANSGEGAEADDDI